MDDGEWGTEGLDALCVRIGQSHFLVSCALVGWDEMGYGALVGILLARELRRRKGGIGNGVRFCMQAGTVIGIIERHP